MRIKRFNLFAFKRVKMVDIEEFLLFFSIHDLVKILYGGENLLVIERKGHLTMLISRNLKLKEVNN